MSDSMSIDDPITKLFSSYIQALEDDNQVRESIKKIMKEVDAHIRHIQTIVNQVHGNLGKVELVCKESRKIFIPIKEEFVKLQQLIKGEQYYKYHDHWKFAITQIVFIATLITWLESTRLLTLKEVEDIVGFPGKNDTNTSFCVELEDYLMGVCNVPGELSRLAVNSVIHGNYGFPIEISKFVTDLYNGFRLLNLKNDNLRKRYDSIKYDIKKIEEVVYDLKIRGLLKS